MNIGAVNIIIGRLKDGIDTKAALDIFQSFFFADDTCIRR